MYIATELTNYSLPQIAREFGKKDHTTVMYARDKINDLMERDEAYPQPRATAHRACASRLVSASPRGRE